MGAKASIELCLDVLRLNVLGKVLDFLCIYDIIITTSEEHYKGLMPSDCLNL